MDKGQPPPYTPGPGMPPHSGIHHPPPPPGFMPPQHHQVMVTTMPVTATVITPLGPESQVMTCPYCHNSISTTVSSEPSSRTHLFALLLCLLGCWPCCCIPYCMDSCQNRNHTCPHCQAFLGTYQS